MKMLIFVINREINSISIHDEIKLKRYYLIELSQYLAMNILNNFHAFQYIYIYTIYT